jgi:hypothetical protein
MKTSSILHQIVLHITTFSVSFSQVVIVSFLSLSVRLPNKHKSSVIANNSIEYDIWEDP